MLGIVRMGVNNIYTVRVGDKDLECRIKGKVLKDSDDAYNPLAVGDRVEVEADPLQAERGLILRRLPRRNEIARWNKKRKRPQILACNLDLLLIISSAAEPPFRPRFIDRMLVASEIGGVKPIIVLNKIDLGLTGDIQRRCQVFKDLGYPVLLVSALLQTGLKELAGLIKGRLCCFIGQSGVGKTSLLNALVPGLGFKIGEISAKYERGAHTTSFALMIEAEDFTLIDTPGIRELDIAGIAFDNLRFYFPEFQGFASACAYPSCLHQVEPGCAVKDALNNGKIDPDRYASYTRLLADLREREKNRYD